MSVRTHQCYFMSGYSAASVSHTPGAVNVNLYCNLKLQTGCPDWQISKLSSQIYLILWCADAEHVFKWLGQHFDADLE